MSEEDAVMRQSPAAHPRFSDNRDSRQSITASEDFYSLSDPGSLDERDASQHNAVASSSSVPHHLFGTPPSRVQTAFHDFALSDAVPLGDAPGPTAAADPQHIHPETPTHAVSNSQDSGNSFRSNRESPPRPPPIFDPRNITFAKPLTRKAIGSSGTSTAEESSASTRTATSPTEQSFAAARLRMEPPSPSITPGLDDRTGVNFALGWMLRDDEEVGQRRPYPAAFGAPTLSNVPSFVPPGHVRQHSAGARPDLPTIPPMRAQRREPQPQPQPEQSLPQQRLTESEADVVEPVPVPAPTSSTGRPSMAREKEMMAGVPPAVQHPLHQSAERASISSTSLLQYDVFVPYDEDNSTRYEAPLKYLPRILSPLWLGLFIFLCIAMTTCLIFTAVWSKKHAGLWEYKTFGDNRYFVFQYLPTLLGMVLLVWLIQIQMAMQRIAPFLAMASMSTRSRSKASFMHLYPTQFLLPNMQYFESHQFIFGACSVAFWLFLFTIPLLASAYNVRFMADAGVAEWRWLPVQGVVWTTVTLYLVLIVFLGVLFGYLVTRQTGLKWDPRTLADIIALLERSNISSDYAGSETFEDIDQFRQRLWTRSDRLGYWHTSRRPQDTFYGIGEEGGATRRYSLEHGRIREKTTGHSRASSQNQPSASEGASHSQRLDLRDPQVVSRHTPWQVKSTALLAFSLTGLVLLIAFLAVAYINQATIDGFPPRLPSEANRAGFSSANFLYSFLPTLLGLLMFLLWQPLDFTERRLAPFTNLATPGGANPRHSLLLDYPATPPLETVLKAVANRDFTVALTASVAAASTAVPVLAGGAFWAQYYNVGTPRQVVRIAAHPAGLYALSLFLTAYAIGLIALFAATLLRSNAALPHAATRLCEVVSWVYMSPLLSDRAFHGPGSRRELMDRLCETERPERRVSSLPPRLTVRIIDDDEGAGAAHNALEGGRGPPPPPIHATPPLKGGEEVREPRFGMGGLCGEGRDGALGDG